MIADSKIYLSDQIHVLKQRWPNHRIVNIVCHGHSVPAGHFWSPVVNTFDAYPHLLHCKLKERFPYAVINVIVTAFAGETSKAGSERFGKDVLIHKPDVVTIDYGLNDRSLSLSEMKSFWSSMIEAARAQNVKILLLTPTWDVTCLDLTDSQPLRERADLIRDLASKYETGLVDSFAEFERYVQLGGNATDLLSGINHPNRKGHEIVATALARYFPILRIDPEDN